MRRNNKVGGKIGSDRLEADSVAPHKWLQLNHVVLSGWGGGAQRAASCR